MEDKRKTFENALKLAFIVDGPPVIFIGLNDAGVDILMESAKVTGDKELVLDRFCTCAHGNVHMCTLLRAHGARCTCRKRGKFRRDLIFIGRPSDEN